MDELEEDKKQNKRQISFEKNDLVFTINFSRGNGVVNSDCSVYIKKNNEKYYSYSFALNASNSSCGFVELRSYTGLLDANENALKTIGEVLAHLPHIVNEARAKTIENKDYRLMDLNFLFGGYLASSPSESTTYRETLKNLGFEHIYDFINYNEGEEHSHDFHFLKVNHFSKYKKHEEQKIKYEVLFK